jgi:Na+/melibiose symporter-like transporter
MNINKKEKEEIKEDFCPSCIMIPVALAGTGLGVAGYNEKGSHQTRKKIMLIGGILITVISLIISIYYLYFTKCDVCSI